MLSSTIKLRKFETFKMIRQRKCLSKHCALRDVLHIHLGVG